MRNKYISKKELDDLLFLQAREELRIKVGVEGSKIGRGAIKPQDLYNTLKTTKKTKQAKNKRQK